jgi:hypothetical protein
VSIAVLLVGSLSSAAAQNVRQVTVGRLTDGEGPTIDGRVAETEWQLAEPYGDFIQQEPNEGQPSTERTEVRFLIDTRNLYIAVICYDSAPAEIVSARAAAMRALRIPIRLRSF